jgi:predicted DNA-binding antitoxin AbrB/MazE fold protein
MAQITEAIFTGGVLKPVDDLSLRESQRVRLIIEPIGDPLRDREAAVKKLRSGIKGMRFSSKGKLPSRDELHDRHRNYPV